MMEAEGSSGSCDPAVREIVGWACGEAVAQAPSALPGSEGEHQLQQKYGTTVQALAFYKHRMLDYLNPAMQAMVVERWSEAPTGMRRRGDPLQGKGNCAS